MNLAALLWAALLLYSALLNTRGMPKSMLRDMRELHLPAALMRPGVAWAHYGAQLLIGAGLILASGTLYWIVSIAGILLATCYLMVVYRARGSVCRCLSTTPVPITNLTLVRNLCVLALAVLALDFENNPVVFGNGSLQWIAVIPLIAIIACEVVGRKAAHS